MPACVAVPVAENNIPVVGKDQVVRGREMHWMRIDRYFEGDAGDPDQATIQPMLCLQCENAPCEVVCPVTATVHSDEGLNDMVYNRCVGTRYCSNNCPYKVRRFNFLLYQDWDTASIQADAQPGRFGAQPRRDGEVHLLRAAHQRGAKIDAKVAGRKLRDGDIKTACQQACPTEAIVFGDINDPDSRVSKLKAEPRNYALLADLDTQPRTTYLAAFRNPNSELQPESRSRKASRDAVGSAGTARARPTACRTDRGSQSHPWPIASCHAIDTPNRHLRPWPAQADGRRGRHPSHRSPARSPRPS